jgi:hypothetical protein
VGHIEQDGGAAGTHVLRIDLGRPPTNGAFVQLLRVPSAQPLRGAGAVVTWKETAGDAAEGELRGRDSHSEISVDVGYPRKAHGL